jgi:hypothetical protein
VKVNSDIYLYSFRLIIRRNILIINNAKLPIITHPVRVIGFSGAIDFTEHIRTMITDVNLTMIKRKKREIVGYSIAPLGVVVSGTCLDGSVGTAGINR